MNCLGSIWASAGDFLLSILELFQRLTGSYGVAIILLTVLVRLLLYPLSHKQMTSMSAMQKIQPRLKILQEKYAGDKQKLNEEMMRLYKENNVNPMAGCLPLLVQLPIMILLFQVLMRYEVADSSFFGINLEQTFLYGLGQALSILPEDGSPVGLFAALSAIASNPSGLANVQYYLPTMLFIIFIAFLTWFQQRISGAGNNPQMATMNTIMPFFMLFICLSLPGGVLIYWGTSSLIGIAQQWIVMRRTKAEIAEKPVLYKNKPVPGQAPKQIAGKAQKEEEEYEDDDEYEYYDDDDEYEDDDYEDEEDGRK